eukprot:COSAG06_NODE_9595_length_1862_cov_4.284742_3_plen_109_part_00
MYSMSLAIPAMAIYRSVLIFIVGMFIEGVYALITTAVSAETDLGTSPDLKRAMPTHLRWSPPSLTELVPSVHASPVSPLCSSAEVLIRARATADGARRATILAQTRAG